MTKSKRVAKKVSPDEYEKNQEYYDHKAMEDRNRMLNGRKSGGRRL